MEMALEPGKMKNKGCRKKGFYPFREIVSFTQFFPFCNLLPFFGSVVAYTCVRLEEDTRKKSHTS